MRILPICVAVAVAATTVRAQPAPQEEEIEGVSYAHPDKPRPKAEWVEVASPTPGANGVEYILVARDAGKFAQLRVDATGVIFLVRVDITYIGGDKQTVRPEKRVDSTHPATIDLTQTKPIESIVVTTDRDTHGSYAVYGRTVAPVAQR